ncbi:hypothetical protein NECAME_11737 [Necator americanus]|uniref:Uncharacterized protein n=1 Tax=Necator americanus TaxID=51031 RepID=W2T2X7_NECAM|nr:hypothetical protein NECAME_11737 [Necator americanus]ETN76355.1 hypothetical protein NECAME_11737 [Necator americanus]
MRSNRHLAGFWQGSAIGNVDKEYDLLVEHLHDCIRKTGSFGATKRRLQKLLTWYACVQQHEPQRVIASTF